MEQDLEPMGLHESVDERSHRSRNARCEWSDTHAFAPTMISEDCGAILAAGARYFSERVRQRRAVPRGDQP